MSNQQIALRLALEALEGSISVSMANIALRHKAITVIKEALAQPEPFGYFKAEPFGWTDCAETDEGAVALYERPPARKPPEWYAQWIRNNYQDYPNIATLCEEMTKAALGIKENK